MDFLPPYNSALDPIERVWDLTRRRTGLPGPTKMAPWLR